MKSFVVTKAEAGQSALKYTQRILKEAPSSFLFKMFRKKNIVLNGKKIEGNEKVSEGDEIKFFLSDETFLNFSGKTKPAPSVSSYMEAYALYGEPDIVYEDEHVLIVNKPTDMLSQKAVKDDLSANEWLIGYLLFHKKVTRESLVTFIPSVCNRLDRNTGGLLLFGKTPFGTNTLNALLRDRSLHKYYQTVVKGRVDEPLNIRGWLLKDEATNKVTVYDKDPDNGASYIETEYTPLEYIEKKDLTVLKVLLVTGKPHQIRAHLSHIGHPIAGDHKYGDASLNKALGLPYQVLFAVELVFPKLHDYPDLSGKTISIKEPSIFESIRK